MRVALYLRVSTNAQAEEGYSLDEQEDRLKAFCKAKNWVVGEVYRDPGYSGANLNRPGLSSLIRNCKEYDAVIVYRLDRLSRSQRDTLYLIEDVFDKNQCSFISVTEGFDTSTYMGKMVVGILSVFAQMERERIKDRMQGGRIERAKTGKTMTWNTPPYGYYVEKDILTIDPIEAQCVKKAYGWYLAGRSQKEIVRLLNGENAKDTPWTSANVKRLLTNPVYTGKTRYLNQEYDGMHEPIVSEDVFYSVQEELKRRQDKAYSKKGTPRPFQSKYLLSGLLRCAECGCMVTVTLYKPRKDGTRTKLYKCVSTMAKSSVGEVKRAESCSTKPHDVDYLEKIVLGEVEKIRLNPQKIEQEQEDTQSISRIEKRLKAIEASEKRLIDLYVAGGLSMSALNDKKESLAVERAELESMLEDKPKFTIENVADVFEKYPGSIFKMPPEDQKIVVRSLIDHIEVGDTARVYWRFM